MYQKDRVSLQEEKHLSSLHVLIWTSQKRPQEEKMRDISLLEWHRERYYL